MIRTSEHTREKPRPERFERQGKIYERKALQQGHVTVNSILRDWIKGQITAVECRILHFEAVFMPRMLAADDRALHQRLAKGVSRLTPPKPACIRPAGTSRPARSWCRWCSINTAAARRCAR